MVLATPNQLHVENALECIRAGVPALVEKPIAHNLAEGLRLCEAAERAQVKLLVGHHRPHSPILHKAIEIVRSGVLGRIVAVIGSAMFYKPDQLLRREAPWRREPGGGPILLNMIHEVGNLRAMVGEIVAVQAFASNAAARLRGRGHGGDQSAVRERRARHVPPFRHRGVREELGADLAGEQELRDLP